MADQLFIDISTPKQLFENSLNLVGNSRIVFSAPFGSGKTFFLKRFFAESERFLALHLYPVNYSVTKNEDIFELIKYDILYELLRYNVSLAKLEVSFSEAIPFLDGDQQVKALAHFLSFIPKIGKPVVEIFQDLKGIMDVINAKRKDLKINEGDKIKQFASNIESQTGSIYEIDLYTNLIIDLVNRLKTEEDKKIVLIIDDLDRIDPDHIFRILNVFASHLDLEKDEENKFAFDKVIVSCDIENIRTVFHNKFGQEVDFSGYIDKFYSREIFEFNNRAIVIQSITKLLTSLKIDKKMNEVNYISNSEKVGFSFVRYVLICFINSNAINLRVLLKFYEKDYVIRNYIILLGQRKFRNWRASITLLFDFLIDLFGDAKALQRAIQKTKFPSTVREELGIWDDNIALLAGELMLLADIVNHQLKPSPKDKPPYSTNLNGKIYFYRIEVYDVMNDRYSGNLVNESNERIYLAEKIDLKAIITMALESYLLINKEFEIDK